MKHCSVLLSLLFCACSPNELEGVERPRPTEHSLAPDTEGLQKERRKAWFEEMHKSAPDVDWQEIERKNGLAAITRRNALAKPQAWQPELVHWVERGSNNQAGRMHVASLSSDGSTLYAGSSKGGLWKGSPGGTDWTPIGDNLYGGAHWMAVVPAPVNGDPDVVLAATDGGLIHVTNDEGKTWLEPTGLNQNYSEVRRVVVTSDGTYTIFVLVRDTGGQNRLMRSTDRGESFSQVNGLGGYEGDVWVPRNGGSGVYLLRGDSLYTSLDNGDSWAVVGSLGSGSSSGELAGSEAGAPRLWAIVQTGAGRQLHRSDDAGASWSYLQGVSDYWGTMSASIIDVDLFAWGGVEVHRTFNGGGSFSIVNGWGEYYGNPAQKLHADVPGLDVVPDGMGGETWYISTDGGLYRSNNGLVNVQNLSLSGLRVSQYYSTLTDKNDSNRIMAGSQDQGYQRGTQPASIGTTHAFTQIISGDYGHLTSGNGTHQVVFSVYPGFIYMVRGTTPGLPTATMDFPAGETHAWMPPVLADDQSSGSFFFCASRIWYYERNIPFWTWTPSLYSPHDFGISGGEYVSAMVFSPLDAQRGYAVTNHGRLYHSEDRGLSWTQSTSTGPTGQYFYGTALVASSLDVDTVWVGGSGYSGPAVYRSTDGGVSFQAWDDGMPNTLVYCMEEAPDGSGDLYAGTETSVLRRRAGAAAWEDIAGNKAPVTTYWSVEALDADNVMRFGTYGRGIWDYRITPPGSASTFACAGGHPADLELVAGTPTLGGSLEFTLELRQQEDAAGAQPYLAISRARQPELCGRPVRGGSLLVSLQAADRLLPPLGGRPAGPAGPAKVRLSLPEDPALLGETLYVQGVLVDAEDPGRRFLTDGVAFTVGTLPAGPRR